MATPVKRGKSWFVQVRKLGITKCKSFRTKAQAQAWAVQMESEILNQKAGIHSYKTLFDALKRYAEEVTPKKRGRRQEFYILEGFKTLPFAQYKLDQITTPLLVEWRDNRLRLVKSSTVNREMNVLSSVLETSRREWQWISINPIRDVRRPKQPRHRDRIYTQEEINRITSYLLVNPDHDRYVVGMAFLFALETAMRRGEITGLDWDHINFETKVALLPKTKNEDSRKVPLSSSAIHILEQLKRFDKPFDISPEQITTLFSRACHKLGIKRSTFHDARATALTNLSKKLTVLQLAKMVGHRDIRSLQIYYRETAEEMVNQLD